MMTERERELYEERIAIVMYEGGLPEYIARDKAWKQIEDLRNADKNRDGIAEENINQQNLLRSPLGNQSQR